MVKHIVLFKLKDEVSAEEKLVVMNKFKEAIEALPAKFDTLEDVKYYATHPDHVAAGRILAETKESRACVDYEL